MAQTTGALSAKNAVIEVSTNGSSWTDISGFANKVDPGDQTREVGDAYTFDGDTAIITAGKRKPLDLKCSVLYTEGASDPFETVRTAYEAGTALYLRFTPKAATTGNFRFTSDTGLVTKFGYPPLEPEKGEPIVIDFTLETPKVTKALIP
jgi:hypothetical protein